jgi:hypothetical protein
MSEQQNRGKKTQRPRKPKTSLGIHGGGGKVKLTEVQKVLLGKGMVQRGSIWGIR